MSFNDGIQQRDAVTVALACGLCGDTSADHVCTVKRYLRNPAVVLVRDLGNDQHLVRNVKGGEEYTVATEVLRRDYEEI